MTVRVVFRHSLRLFVFIWFLIWPGLAHPQDVGLLRVGSFHGSLQFHMQNEDRYTPILTEERIYNETIILRNSGYLINPLLLTFRWQGDLGLMQERFFDQNLLRYTRGRFLSQSVTASLFEKSTHPLLVAVNKSANNVRFNYGGCSDYNINNFQATLDLPTFFLQSRLHAVQRGIWEKWSRAGFTIERNQIRRMISYSGVRHNEHSSLELDYDFFGSHNRLLAGRRYSTQNMRLYTNRTFGRSYENVWNSNVFFSLRKGLSDYKSIRTVQSVELQHYPWLTSRYRYHFSAIHTPGQMVQEHTLFASLTHRLYNSLKTTTGIGGSYGKSKPGTSGSIQVNGSINYTKKIPLSGYFQVGYSRTRGYTDRKIESYEQLVVNERHVFFGELPVILDELDIIASSITIIDEENNIIYEEGEGKDYFLRNVGDYIEIHRNVLGRIRENAVVLVDYRFHTLPTMSYTTVMEMFNATLSFGGLSLYHWLNNHDVDNISGSLARDSFLSDIFSRTTGVKWGVRGGKTGISVLAEYKTQHSKSIAFNSIDIRNVLFVSPFRNFTLASNLSLSLLDYTREHYKIKAYIIGSDIRWRPTVELNLQGFTKYRIRRETDRNDELSYEYGTTVQRLWRVVRLLVSYEKRKWQLGPRLIDERRFTVEIERIF